MKFKLALSTATALGLLMGGAMADNNITNLTQSGDKNKADIDQSAATNSNAGSTSYVGQHRVVQEGTYNQLQITQEGNSNKVAAWASSHPNKGSTGHFWQTGLRNDATITQNNPGHYGGNAVLTVYQWAEMPGSNATTNKLTITQGGSGGTLHQQNLVRSVDQTNDSAVSAGPLSGPNTDLNSITITQKSVGVGNGYGGGNFALAVKQNGSGNSFDLTQTGLNNLVSSATQLGAGNNATIAQIGDKNAVETLTQDGSSNEARITLTGDRNGIGAGGSLSQNGASQWHGPNSYSRDSFTTASAAAGIGVDQGVVLQYGEGNSIDYAATGNANLFGLVQFQDDNAIHATVSGNYNELAVKQDGLYNHATVLQEDDSNNAGISQVGNYNNVNAKQTGGDNSLSAQINGDHNGDATNFGNTVLNNIASARGLTPGDIFQTGGGFQTLTLTINSSNNQFAFLQTGGISNTITADIYGGNGNKALGVQDGSGNIATLVQNGASNTALFQQIGDSNVSNISQ